MRIVAAIAIVSLGSAWGQTSLTLPDVAANRKLWPKAVTVNVAHTVPIVINGKPSGSMQVPSGRSYPLKSVSAELVSVDAHGSTMTFAAAETDLLAKAEENQTLLAAQAAATPPLPSSSPSPTPKPPAPPALENALAVELADNLVTLSGKKFSPFDASSLAGKKYLALYFSASWCPPCRAFTPDLVKFYKRKKAFREKFDVVFISNDRSEEAMLDYMKSDDMEWPALDYKNANRIHPLTKYGGKGIPRLVVVDENGTVVSDSYQGDKYIGPRKVLQDLEKLLKNS